MMAVCKLGKSKFKNRHRGHPIAQSYPNPSIMKLLKALGSYSFQNTIDKSQRKLRKRRIPDGTYGVVEGRPLK
jgi:hypothetical protein